MSKFEIQINGTLHKIEVDPDMPLLWVLRDIIDLKGTKYGCGIGMCGACTVHSEGKPVRSCQIPIGAIKAKKITTIEGLTKGELHPVQKSWIALQVPQCGYCQSGQLMSAAALLAANPHPDSNAIDVAMSGNLCRCGTYDRIKKGIIMASETINGKQHDY
jgi:isoquinoline 1-oxidoreductase subunit alpha